nr:hypothetical protein BgiMline_016735 [Biomphalaria glabrata]
MVALGWGLVKWDLGGGTVRGWNGSDTPSMTPWPTGYSKWSSVSGTDRQEFGVGLAEQDSTALTPRAELRGCGQPDRGQPR